MVTSASPTSLATMAAEAKLEFSFDFSEFAEDIASVQKKRDQELQEEIARRVNSGALLPSFVDPLPPACRPLHIIIIGLSATLIRTLLFINISNSRIRSQLANRRKCNEGAAQSGARLARHALGCRRSLRVRARTSMDLYISL